MLPERFRTFLKVFRTIPNDLERSPNDPERFRMIPNVHRRTLPKADRRRTFPTVAERSNLDVPKGQNSTFFAKFRLKSQNFGFSYNLLVRFGSEKALNSQSPYSSCDHFTLFKKKYYPRNQIRNKFFFLIPYFEE